MELPAEYSKLHWKERRAVREAYVKLQEGICMFCGHSLEVRPLMDKQIYWDLFPANFLQYPIHLQHNHETDMTEGAVHAYCNAVLWQHHGR